MWQRIRRWWHPAQVERAGFERWPSRGTYLAVGVAAATGASMLWRLPALGLTYGGGTVLVAIAVCIAVIGLPLLILEAGVGQQTQRAAPRAWRSLDRRWEWLGWGSVLLACVLIVLHVVLVLWALSYAVAALQVMVEGHELLPWDAQPARFLDGVLLGQPGDATGWSIPAWTAWLGLLGIWGALALLVASGPRLFGDTIRYSLFVGAALLAVFVVRQVMWLADPNVGAVFGLEWALRVEWSMLGRPDLWLAATGHTLMTFGLGLGLHVGLAAHLPREADIANNARLIGLTSSSAMLAAFLGLAIVMGMLALHDARQVGDIPAMVGEREDDVRGIGVAMLIVPQALAVKDETFDTVSLRALWASCFFGAIATFSFLFATVALHTVVTALRERWALRRGRATALAVGVGGLVSAGLIGFADWAWFDWVDRWIAQVGVMALVLAEVVALGWIIGLGRTRRGINRVSEQPVSAVWDVCIRGAIPVALIALLAHALQRAFAQM